MTPDQLDDAGWSPEQWSALNELARATVNKHSRVRGLIPKGPDMPGAYTISVPTISGGAEPVTDTSVASQPVIRMRAKFKILAEQVGDLDLVGRMIVGRARELAAATDDVLANGGAVRTRYSGNAASVLAKKLAAATPGLVPSDAALNTDVFVALATAVGELRKNGRVGPFAAACSASFWKELVLQGGAGSAKRDGIARAADLLETDRANLALFKDGKIQIGGTDIEAYAIVFEPSPTAVDVVTVQAPRIAFVGYADGDLLLRVEQAFFLRVMGAKFSWVAAVPPPGVP